MKPKPLHAEVRFHLLNGKNYRKWQVNIMRGRKRVDQYYVDPAEYQLEMRGCKLVNKLARAKWVHKKQKKNVSGWVQCEEVILNREIGIDNLEKLYYNPIRDPRWRRESDCGEFAWDGSEYATLITQDRQVYILEERV
ncbi:MAG: hypothetical protein EBT86_11445 [Actinobacteria bacterium]|nr:hypothetical protein [Actinomycetota bacterium]